MERGFYNDEFEELLKQKADQYKMYPSDHVWKGINRSLHTRKKWYWLSFVLFLAGITYYAIVQLIAPSSTTKKPIATINPNQAAEASSKANNGKPAVVIPFSEQIRQTRQGKDVTAATPATERSFVLNPDNDNHYYPAAATIQTAAIVADHIDPVTITTTGKEKIVESALTEQNKKTGLARTLLSGSLNTIPAGDLANQSGPEGIQLITTPDQPAADNTLATDKKATAVPNSKTVLDKGAIEDEQRISWLQRYAVYELAVPATKRLSWQLSFSPTMNYRKLTGNDATISSDIKNVPIAQNVAGNPDKLVNHKPALGFEMGSHFFYAVNKTLQIRAGAQFNYSRYAIQAYGSYQADVATIALNSSPRREDSITNLTQIRNFGGDVSEDLQNQYFQLSLPVGLQVRLLGNGKVQLGAAATVQPTYLINRNSYLITTDFKNYTKEPSLIRKWNLNSSAEIFITYKTGDLKWQIGPQFRYQLFSTYAKEYPIREYMMEYGIKFGVTKSLR